MRAMDDMKRRPKKSSGRVTKSPLKAIRLYTLDVFIIAGPMNEKFVTRNPLVSRTIQIRGDQTLENLHDAIFYAFNRFDPHLYEFQFGKGPNDPKAKRYSLPTAFEGPPEKPWKTVGVVTQTTLDSLGLKNRQAFGYWFDFRDDWWHQINVVAIEDKAPAAKYPKITKRVGESPPQYRNQDDED
jgi:hypothetical protein